MHLRVPMQMQMQLQMQMQMHVYCMPAGQVQHENDLLSYEFMLSDNATRMRGGGGGSTTRVAASCLDPILVIPRFRFSSRKQNGNTVPQ